MVWGSNLGMEEKYLFFSLSLKWSDRLRGTPMPWRESGHQLHLVQSYRSLGTSLPLTHAVVFKLIDLFFCSILLRQPFSAQKETLVRLTAAFLTAQCIRKQHILISFFFFGGYCLFGRTECAVTNI
jgi:hypothetical protein